MLGHTYTTVSQFARFVNKKNYLNIWNVVLNAKMQQRQKVGTLEFLTLTDSAFGLRFPELGFEGSSQCAIMSYI